MASLEKTSTSSINKPISTVADKKGQSLDKMEKNEKTGIEKQNNLLPY